MAKLHSPPTERIAVRGMCSRDPKIAGQFLASLEDSHFYSEASLEAHAAIQRYLKRKGETPAFRVLVEDLKLSEETREFLVEESGTPKTTAEANQVIERLNEYRHTRIFYNLCKNGLATLQAKTVSVEALVGMTQDTLAAMQMTKDIESQLFHIGKDGNSDELMKEILYGERRDQWIPTGWKTFDTVNGGMPRGGLILLGGASGAGKCIAPDTLVTLDVLQLDIEDLGLIEIPGSTLLRVTCSGVEQLIPSREFSAEHHELLELPANVQFLP